jgi:hypothetical protein
VSDRHQQSLAMRRRELVLRSAAQRDALMANLVPIAQKVAKVDNVIASVKRYPMVTAAIAGAVTLFGSKKLFSLLARGVTLYTLLRKI